MNEKMFRKFAEDHRGEMPQYDMSGKLFNAIWDMSDHISVVQDYIADRSKDPSITEETAAKLRRVFDALAELDSELFDPYDEYANANI